MMIAHNVLLVQCAADIRYEFSKVMDVIIKLFWGLECRKQEKGCRLGGTKLPAQVIFITLFSLSSCGSQELKVLYPINRE